ncbi:peptidase M13 [Aestuariibacter halophilus]|uniref:Peptidase M13 n=1 Tax=Fluctibacter halophilus TaxID=226011 RepID=A0ABS8GED9_9ALTE|nr:M13-type metalloendopeptidase [Aestuariibacter halophilus]MCC2618270.1 peptidase M13 [Aestuariibacter halophilus]
MKLKLTCIAAALALSACGQAPQQSTETAASAVEQAAEKTTELNSGILTQNMDLSVKPGDDFFQYVNGKWLDNTEIPADKSSYGGFTILRDEAQEDVMEIIRASAEGDFKKGSDEQRVGDLYQSYMDMETRNKTGLAPLQAELAKVDAIDSHDALATYFAYANRYGYGGPFNVGQYVDFKDPNRYMIYSWQAGLGLPDREFYFKDDPVNVDIRDKYLAHIANMLDLAGIGNGKANADMIMTLETRLAEQHMKKEQTRNMVALYNKVPVTELADLMPNFNWSGYLQEAQLSDLDGLVVTQMDYMRALDGIIQDVSLDDWKTYLKWNLVNATAGRLTEDLDNANFAFYGKVLRGVEEQLPLWRRAVTMLNNNVGEIIGKVYVKKHFPPEAKERMLEMVNNLLKAYEISINELDWMTDETRAQALDKLSKFTPKIGYPDKWRDYSDLTIAEDDLFGNLARSAEVQYAQMLDKQNGPVQKHEWGMTPQTVNAYYNPPMNEIVFPAAILQPPFFNMEAEDAVNYGGIGAVIGHEIGHGFDDSGSTFDGDGVLRNWWTDVDKSEFEKRTAQLVQQYNEFEALEGLNVNGEFTLGENIGDLGGISIALKAYHLSLDGKPAPVIDGFTGDQRVFIGFGQVWANKYRDEALRNQIETDPHSPSHFRANGSVRNVPEFYEAFDVTPENALYLAPEQRVKIW